MIVRKKLKDARKMSVKELADFDAIEDKDIDTSDVPEYDSDFWKDVRPAMPNSKKAVTLHLDADVIEWFKKQGKGYQTRINNILRSYMKTQQRA